MSSLVVFNDAGARISAPDAVNAFFGADPSSTFISDPRCYYDRATQRWFVSVTNVYDSTNNYRSNLFLAVSQTSDPRGAYFVYSIDTTDDGLDGTPSNPGCSTDAPCFGDQPTLGADAYGVYLTTNEFSQFSNTFNGSQIYAISKSALEAGTASSLVHIGDIPLAEGIAYSVQPASSPDLSDEDRSGVEYFLSALDFYGTLDNRIAVWAMGNTNSLASSTPSVTLTDVIVRSEAYGLPPNATQKAGPYPLGQSLGEPEELIDSGDDRMQNVVYASGHLWGGLNTIVSDGTNTNAGIAYFDVKPDLRPPWGDGEAARAELRVGQREFGHLSGNRGDGRRHGGGGVYGGGRFILSQRGLCPPYPGALDWGEHCGDGNSAAGRFLRVSGVWRVRGCALGRLLLGRGGWKRAVAGHGIHSRGDRSRFLLHGLWNLRVPSESGVSGRGICGVPGDFAENGSLGPFKARPKMTPAMGGCRRGPLFAATQQACGTRTGILDSLLDRESDSRMDTRHTAVAEVRVFFRNTGETDSQHSGRIQREN